MNLVLLLDGDFTAPDRVRLEGRRARHVNEVHRAQVGDVLQVGRLDGMMGTGRVLALDAEALELEVDLGVPPPPKLPLTLVLAVPRPKVLNRVLASATALGVARIHLVNAWRVEKAYWRSPRMEASNLLEQRLLGLEQARDTVLPDLVTHRLLRPFAEDVLPGLAAGTRALVAHPGSPEACPRALEGPVTLAVGPEGGWLPEEVALLGRAGLEPVHLGDRILRVETAVTALVARLF